MKIMELTQFPLTSLDLILSQRGWKLWRAQGFPNKNHSREIAQTRITGLVHDTPS